MGEGVSFPGERNSNSLTVTLVFSSEDAKDTELLRK